MGDYREGMLSRLGRSDNKPLGGEKLGRELLGMDLEELEQAATDEAGKFNLSYADAQDAYDAGALPTNAVRLKALFAFIYELRKDETGFECKG